MKSRIVEHIGEPGLLLPAMVAAGLAANDRVKVRLSVLQAAGRRGRDPQGAVFDLTAECRAAGVDPLPLERLVNQARLTGGDRLQTPGLGELLAGIGGDMEEMIRAVEAGDPEAGPPARERLATHLPDRDGTPADTIAVSDIERLAALPAASGDSLHRLVMDLHKSLNRLAAEHAEETVLGARVFGLEAGDRAAVEAFMRGVDATRHLKFDHPGLSATAARSAGRLMIQNDIGETDAHVVVIAVEDAAVTVTYTDVHLPRARFLAGLLRDFPVAWSGLDRKSTDRLGGGDVFFLVTGRHTFEDAGGRDAFLEALGGSLVFLIDWNKARKVLRGWVPKADAVGILDWAARQRLGHRAFLQLGGGELVAAAVQNAAPSRIGFGDRLDHVLGREAAIDFLHVVLRVSSESLAHGTSVRLARDRIEADLARRLKRVDATLLAVVQRQAGLARDIAAAVGEAVRLRLDGRPFDGPHLAADARRIEEKADRIAIGVRADIARFEADPSIGRLADRIEEVIDELEQAAFVASLLPDGLSDEVLSPLAGLCAAAIGGTEAAAGGVAAAVMVPEGHRIDSEDALAAAGRLLEFEHDGDRAERAVMTVVLTSAMQPRDALAALELARSLERATDRLAGFGHLLRGHVLTELTG